MDNFHSPKLNLIVLLLLTSLFVGLLLKYSSVRIIEGNANMNEIKPEWEFDTLQTTMFNRLKSQFEKFDKLISKRLDNITLHMNEKSANSKSIILLDINTIMQLYKTKQYYLRDLPALFSKNVSVPEQREDLLSIYNELNKSSFDVTDEKLSDVINTYIDSQKENLMKDIKDLPDDKAIKTVKSNMFSFDIYHKFLDQINESINLYLSEEEKQKKSATNVGVSKDIGIKTSSS